MTVTTTNMLCDDDRLRNEILWLISLGHEGGYWDFKSDYPECNEDKLMDIICMANNLENRNAYLIYGVNDDGSVCGIENTSHPRLKTINFVQFLRERPFAGGYVPVVELKTFMIEDHEVDVLIVSNSKHTPYFLSENYEKSNDKRKWLRAGAIYTRKQDENTPRNKTASFGDTELLWRKRFGVFMQPFDKFRILLRDISNWSDTNWDVVRRCYHKWNPEFQIIASDSSESWEALRYFYDDERMMYAPLCLNYLSTTLYETSLWFMDMGRCVIPEPRRKTVFGDFCYYYFLMDTVDGDIFNLITNGCCFCHNRSGLEMPVLIFADKFEQDDYEKYISDKVVRDTAISTVSQSASYQHTAAKEERDGIPQIGGVKTIAASFYLFKKWKNEGEL